MSSRRTVGWGPNPIQLSEIKAYMEIFGIPTCGETAFINFIVLMDAKYLELSATKK